MADLETRIAQARGDEPADLVLRAGIYDLITGEMIDGDVAICGDTIVGVGEAYDGREVRGPQGLTLVPGFIDTHLHVESSLVTPFEFDRCVTPRASPPRSAIPTRSPTSSARRACGISRRRRNTR
jgi:adenine deaminase